MKKVITAIGLFTSATIAFGTVLNKITGSQFMMNHIPLAMFSVLITCFGWFWLVTFGVETVWPQFLTAPDEAEVLVQI